MSFFRRTLERFLRSAEKSRRAARSSATSCRPSLEMLEDRCVPSVSWQGGYAMPNFQVDALFLGQQWSSNAQYSVARQVVSFLSDDTGPYTTFIQNMYPNVGTGTYRTAIRDLSSIPSNMDDYNRPQGGLTNLQNYIVNDINGGYLPRHTNGNQLGNQVYIVHLPPDTTVSDPHGTSNVGHFKGYHSWFNYNGQTYVYAVVPYPGQVIEYTANTGSDGANSDLDDLTAMTSHELAEAVTDPINYPGYEGWVDPNNPGVAEIGDIPNAKGVPYIKLNGFVVEPLADQYGNSQNPPGSTPFTPGSPPPASQPPSTQPGNP